jgi:hypothetical protein
MDKSYHRGLTKRLGFFAVVLIQFLGPPFIFVQYWLSYGLEEHEIYHWEFWSPSLSDWSVGEQYYLTKFIAVLFLLCFILNGLFCHLDEKNAWEKICKIINMLNHNGEMEDSCMTFLYLSAFMNTWVIFWLCIDVWLVLGKSDTVTDVLMDALGLTFLYNLDDIGSDLRFVDDDDWPGLQLAWVDKFKKTVSHEYDDIDDVDTEPPEVCTQYLKACAGILGFFAIVLPLLFVITPFKAMLPDPFFETITQAMWANATHATVAV